MIPNRYSAHGPQAEFEPGSRSRVLRNRLGIVRVRDMQQVESDALLAVQEWAIGHFSASHRFAAGDVTLLHRRWLDHIYPWAGEYRQVNVSKGGLMFAASSQVPRLMAEFEVQERCARLLGWLMALQAGWPPLDFSPLSGRGRVAYFAAIQAALARDYVPLQACFSRVLTRTLRAASAPRG